MAYKADGAELCPRTPTGGMFGLEEELVYGDEARGLVAGSTVLVTGAGGSIGSELVRQARRLGAARVICVDRDEYSLYRLQLESSGQALLTGDELVLADVGSRVQMADVFKRHHPDLVFHAAACKHLPLLERHPAIAVMTNVAGTMNVATLAAEHGTRRFVNISTDKAANPDSVLGMTKRLAEIVTVQLAVGTLPASVRFGNVFASRGSFIETLAWQVSRGLPVTITDAAMTRYFMTIPRAAGLVISASYLSDGLSTFILEMGAPHRIVDLVTAYASACGYPAPEIRFTGRREGEKLAEDLVGSAETPRPTAHPAITAVDALAVRLDDISALCGAAAASASSNVIRRMLHSLMLDISAPSHDSAITPAAGPIVEEVL